MVFFWLEMSSLLFEPQTIFWRIFYNFFDEILAVFSICKIHPAISSCFVAPWVYEHNRGRPNCNLLHSLLGGGKISGSCKKKLQNLIDIGFFPTVRALLFPSSFLPPYSSSLDQMSAPKTKICGLIRTTPWRFEKRYMCEKSKFAYFARKQREKQFFFYAS